MIFKKCAVCKSNTLSINFKKNKKDSLMAIKNNTEKYGLRFILNDKNIEIISIYQCKRCEQKTVKIKNLKNNEVKEIWLEYLSKLRIIERELNNTHNKMQSLKMLSRKNKDAISKKLQLLSQDYEIFKLQKENLKPSMMASISIKLHSII